ncbi:NAD-dependent malic enzyme, partial [Candidatus Saccharibacteria bacterium]|nr:NAD-dependent malic enzyme [Candidatus Saccharibacteria bacterium]
GAGAAVTAIAKLLLIYSTQPSCVLKNAGGLRRPEIVMVDSQGIIHRQRQRLSPAKAELAKLTNPHNLTGDLKKAVDGADIFIGVSQPGLLKPAMIKTMRSRPIVFAMANPLPEIMPAEAYKAGAAVVATGRSDLPNQVNNALAFPGIFRGALDNQVRQITDQHKIAAAKAIASLVKKPTRQKIIPTIFDRRLAPAIAKQIK